MNEKQTIQNSLDVIRKALEDEGTSNVHSDNDNVLILNQLIKKDGTIDLLDNDNSDDNNLKKSEVSEILKNKLDDVFEIYFTKWLDKNLPQYIEKYFKNKKI